MPAETTEIPAVKGRWVVKAGSNLIGQGGPLLLRAWMLQLAQLKRKFGIEVIWVTSGAIASAMERTSFSKPTRTLPEKQALSAIGQPLLMDLYNLSLQAAGLTGAQILLTYDDMTNASRKKNLQNTLETLLSWQIVPVLNENDAVATEEIKFGDNDSLSAKVACMTKADRLILLTDVQGLYDDHPGRNPDAHLLGHVTVITDELLAKVEQVAGSGVGTGGMYSKLLAAREANAHGIDTWLLKGDLPNALISLARNEHLGTRIGPSA